MFTLHNPQEIYSEKLLDELTTITQDAFGSGITREDVKNHAFGPEILYLLKQDELVGFGTCEQHIIEDKNVLYFAGCAIAKKAQSSGVYKRFRQQCLEDFQPDYFVTHTQNPIIYGALQELGTLYPPLDAVPEEVTRIARYFGGPQFDPETFIEHNRYETSLYSTPIVHRDKKIDKLFRSLSDEDDNKNAYVIIGIPK